MGRVVRRFRTKPTVFLILAALAFIIGIPLTLYGMGLDGGGSLFAILPIARMFIGAIALWIDYGLVNYTKIRLLWINMIEVGMLVACWGGCCFQLILEPVFNWS